MVVYCSPTISKVMKNHSILFEIKLWQLEQSRVAVWLPRNVVEKNEIEPSVKYSALRFHLQRTKKKMLCACHHYIMKIRTYYHHQLAIHELK